MSNNVSSTSSNANNFSSISDKRTNTINLPKVMNNISNNVNPKSVTDGLGLISKPDELIARLQSGADQFKEQTGRPMTYSEMRQMFG